MLSGTLNHPQEEPPRVGHLNGFIVASRRSTDRQARRFVVGVEGDGDAELVAGSALRRRWSLHHEKHTGSVDIMGRVGVVAVESV